MDDSTESPSAGTISEIQAEEAPPPTRSGDTLSAALAGLQAGMLGALCMLTWLGIDSSWDRRGFWNNENLFATFFYGDNAIHAGFGLKTMPGLALYLIVYSALGCIFVLAVRNRFRPLRRFLAALIFAMGWFYLSFHLLWKGVMPLVYLLYADRPMILGHLIWGACLYRFPAYLPQAESPSAPALASEPLEPAEPVPPSTLE
jgi:hypothetical protein